MVAMMSRETIGLTGVMQRWLIEHGVRECATATALRAAMETHPDGRMQTSPEQAQFLCTLIHALGATRVLEIGVFTGYSALRMASALPTDGRLVACDIDARYMDEAQRWWSQAGVGDRIDARVGPALDTLDALLDTGAAGSFDLMYIDADKTSSDAYCERGLQLLRVNGVIAVDNMFRGGRVADPQADDESTVATRALAAKWADDPRVAWSLLPVGDGLGLLVKKA